MKSNFTRFNCMAKLFLSIVIGLLLCTGKQVVAQTRAVYFVGYNSSTASFPKAASGMDGAVVSAGAINYSGLQTVNDNRTVWNNPNSATTLDIGTAPYLSFTITMNGNISLSPDRFVMCGLAEFSSTKLQLRWSVDNFATSLGEFTINGSSYTLSSVDLSSKGVVNVSSIEFRVYFYNASGWVFNSDTGPYSSLDGTPSSYGAYGQNVALWYNSFTTLPLVWNSFTVEKDQHEALLKWSTENEVAVAGFSVEHSKDGRVWQSIGYVPADNSAGVNYYSYRDKNPFAGLNYYRLLQTDLDGNKKYSSVSMLSLSEDAPTFILLENPVVSGMLRFRINSSAYVRLYSLTGQLLVEKQFVPGDCSIDVHKMPEGIYSITTGTASRLVLIK